MQPVDFLFSKQQEAFRGQMQQIAQHNIKQELSSIDADIFPENSIQTMADHGVLGIPIPTAYGGLGKDYISYIIAIHELSKVSASVGVILSVHTSVATNPILQFGTEEQKKHYLPKLASGDYLGAFALTEPSAGSDAAKLKLKAKRQDDVYILNGSKIFITNGKEADSFITFARTGDEKGAKGISAFIVEKNTPGFSVGKSEEKMGLHGTSTVTLHFDHCKIPVSQRLGAESQGFHIAMANLNGGRIGIAAQALGIAEAAYEYTRDWARQLPEKEQHLLFTLADMATKVEAAKLMVYRAASLMEKGEKCIREVSTAKLLATKTAREITIDAIQTIGYTASRKGSPLERYFRDAKVTEIYEGTSEIQKVVISKQLAQS